MVCRERLDTFKMESTTLSQSTSSEHNHDIHPRWTDLRIGVIMLRVTRAGLAADA